MENSLISSIKSHIPILILYPALSILVYLTRIDKYFNIDKQYHDYNICMFMYLDIINFYHIMTYYMQACHPSKTLYQRKSEERLQIHSMLPNCDKDPFILKHKYFH